MHEGSRTNAAFGTAVTATARVVGDRQRDESTNRDGHDTLVKVTDGQLEDALAIGGDPFPMHIACGEGLRGERWCGVQWRHKHNIFRKAHSLFSPSALLPCASLEAASRRARAWRTVCSSSRPATERLTKERTKSSAGL